MHNVDIKIFYIAQTRMNPGATRKWLDHVGASEYPVPRKEEVTDAGAVCGLCAKRCYMSFEPGLNPNVTRVRKDWYKFLSNIIKSGHGSVLEHASWTFAIEGVSRVFTGEMNRHRAGVAISEGSMRYIRFDDIPFWMPHSLLEGNRTLMPTSKCHICKGKEEDCELCHGTGRLDLMTKEDFEDKKSITRLLFKDAFTKMEDTYKSLCTLWGIQDMKSFATKKKLTSLFRRIIGMGVATGGTWTINTRALRHIAALRTTPGAEEEIAYVIGEIGKIMLENEPALFGDFTRDESTGAWIPGHAKV